MARMPPARPPEPDRVGLAPTGAAGALGSFPAGDPVTTSEHHQGCLLCGADLVYRLGAATMTCALCGAARDSAASCAAGHYVCDACHGGKAKDVIERFCAATTLTDPVAIAQGLMHHPSVKLHGPEHHFLVPAALLAALSNARGEPERRAERVAEARRRAEPLVGGMCGFQGACGAAIGAGIFASIATGATPLATDAWRLSNGLTARALETVARAGGPRCCKRDTYLSVLTGARFARESLGVDLEARGVACDWSGQNKECLGADCAFHRGGVPAAS